MPAFTSSPGRIRISFGAAHLAKSLVWSFVDLLLAYFLYSVLHVPADRIARLLFIFLMFGAGCDALVGIAMTWLRARPRTVLMLHLIGAVGAGAALFAKFHLTLEAPWLILAAGLVFRLAFALYDVPQTALTSLLPIDEADARAYVRLRTTLGAVARLAVTAVNLGLAQLPARIFHVGGAATLLAMGGLIVISAVNLMGVAGPTLKARVQPTPTNTGFAAPPGLLVVLAAFLVSTTLFASLSRLLIFTPAPSGFRLLGAWLLLAFSIGNVAGPLLAPRLEAQVGRRAALSISAAAAIVFGDLLLAAPAGCAPPLQIAAAAIYGLGLSAVGAYLWEAASRIVRSHAARTGERTDGMVFGLVIFTIQISIALGSLLLGAVLEDHVRDGLSSALTAGVVNTAGGVLVTLLLLDRRAAPQA